MQPITREAITDRREPGIRWGAVLAGTVIAAGLWGVLQLLAIGAGLASIDPDEIEVGRSALRVGTPSLLAPLLATFIGGYLAARLASTRDRRVAAAHGLVVWGLTAIIGLGTTQWLAEASSIWAAHARPAEVQVGDAPMTTLDAATALNQASDVLVPINQRLQQQGKPQISPHELLSSARAAADEDGFNADEFVEKLDDRSALSRVEVAEVARQLGPQIANIVEQAGAVTADQHAAMRAAETTGKALLSLGAVILLSIGTALLGALVGVRARRDPDDATRRGPHAAAPYPATPTSEPTATIAKPSPPPTSPPVPMG